MDNNSFYKSNILKPIITLDEFLMMGNPMLLCKECQEKIERLNTAWDKAFREERKSNK